MTLGFDLIASNTIDFERTHFSNFSGDSLGDEVKKNIIKRYFEKRAEKKAKVKDSITSLKDEVLQEILRLKRLKPSDTLYDAKAQYQFHYKDLQFYLENFKDTNYKSEQDWAKIQRIDTKPFNSKKTSLQSSKYVYGFHPYWMGNAYYNYNFEVYNRIAYYGYVINPKSGEDLSTPGGMLAHSWSTSTIQSKANYYDCKVDLCVASYDIENNIKIFENTSKAKDIRAIVIRNIVSLVKGKGDGVCFDLQKIPSRYKKNYISFIQQINRALNGDSIQGKLSKEYEITVLVPRYDIGFPYSMTLDDAAQLKNHVDRWIYTAESTYGSNYTVGEITEENMQAFWNFDHIDFELNALPPSVFESLIIEVPLYYAKNLMEKSDSTHIISHVSDMNVIYPEFSALFNNSLQERLTYADLKGINGIALWCTGYGNKNQELQKTLIDYIQNKGFTTNDNFIPSIKQLINENEVDIVDLYKKDQSEIESSWLSPPIFRLLDELKPEKIMSHHLVVLCLLILLSFVFSGFMIALFFESARDKIFSKENIMNISTILVVLIVVLIFKKFNVITETEFVFAVGIFTGMALVMLFYRRIKKKEKELTP